ncbi:alanine--tRNA ligase [Candidatus Campbellbacteria bacterium]|nr:MAG: alanine--tRNA ligase [Candidatus Campbellbacteria bacterium]
MPSHDVRKKFLEFFAKRGHAIIPSASLIPENDASVLFTTAGMHPLVPYLLGEKHPLGTRLVNVQKCVRTGDIDDVGDSTHATFFEMMGNWSLGDYFKKEAISWSFELLTSKEEGFGLDPQRLYVTCFEGNDDAPRDEESAEIWRDLFARHGVSGERIYFMPAKNNWWQAGPNGPCGPDTEMFYDLTGTLASGMTKEAYLKADTEQKIVEIWNDVFMEYVKKDDTVVGKLERKNIDTGSGFERICAVLQGKDNIFDTDIFEKVMAEARELSRVLRSQRIISDHIRSAVFMIGDGVLPSNTDRGYVLRRLIRRAVFNTDTKKLSHEAIEALVEAIVDTYGDTYEVLPEKKDSIIATIFKESEKFAETLTDGTREIEKVFQRMNSEGNTHLSGAECARLYQSYGFPIELTREVAQEHNFTVDTEGFFEEMKKHQELSRAGSEQKFKGGLADASPEVTRLHTATHLLNAALREVLGAHVKQRGSNITSERLRFDFAHPTKMTDEEKKRVQDIVNTYIQNQLEVKRLEMPKSEAETLGAEMEFGAKYPDVVSVYVVHDAQGTVVSREFCGGPHVTNTRELGHFKIVKEEAVAAGIRRIKAVLS